MLASKFNEFRNIVLGDDSLQKELRILTDRTEFIDRVIDLARSLGYEFTSEDIEEELRVGRRSWTEHGI